MSSRQTFAKIAVFLLLGVNVAAYFYFWPRDSGRRTEIAETEVKPAPLPAKPRDFPAAPAQSAAPVLPPPPKESEWKSIDPLSRLLDHIKREAPSAGGVEPIPTEVERPEVVLPLPPQPQPGNLPQLKGPAIEQARPDADVAIASGLKPKRLPSPWIVETRLAGARPMLIAKLRVGQATFEIQCDRIDPHAKNGTQALGNVVFVGPGIKGSCRRLTISADAPTIVFEHDVRITPDANSQLASERLVWEQPAVGVDLNATEFRPAGLLLPAKIILGPPK